MPWLGIEPMTARAQVQHLIHWATTPTKRELIACQGGDFPSEVNHTRLRAIYIHAPFFYPVGNTIQSCSSFSDEPKIMMSSASAKIETFSWPKLIQPFISLTWLIRSFSRLHSHLNLKSGDRNFRLIKLWPNYQRLQTLIRAFVFYTCSNLFCSELPVT